MRYFIGFIVGVSVSFLLHFSFCTNEKSVIGEAEVMRAASLSYVARIDTGARITSIHAYDINIEDENEDITQNIGKKIHFTTSNEKDERSEVDTIIVDVKKVRNAQGIEHRYVIDLPITWHGDTFTSRVNLRDRSRMSYKLLIGRNWLEGRHIVDVNHGTTINSATKAK